MFIEELSPFCTNFSVRITGGEPGLVGDIHTFFKWCELQNLKKVTVFSNGLLFNKSQVKLHTIKVYDHIIQDVIDGDWIRYEPSVSRVTPQQCAEIIQERKMRCKSYVAVVVDTGLDNSTKQQFEELSLKIVPQFGVGMLEYNKTFVHCLNSKSGWLYDVAFGLFYPCCDCKDPSWGIKEDSLLNYLFDTPIQPHSCCATCLPSHNPQPDEIKALQILKVLCR